MCDSDFASVEYQLQSALRDVARAQAHLKKAYVSLEYYCEKTKSDDVVNLAIQDVSSELAQILSDLVLFDEEPCHNG